MGRVSVWGDETVMGMDSGDGYTAPGTHLMPLRIAKMQKENGNYLR